MPAAHHSPASGPASQKLPQSSKASSAFLQRLSHPQTQLGLRVMGKLTWTRVCGNPVSSRIALAIV
jgi:hypothetical protein